jgi:hypothetical protein
MDTRMTTHDVIKAGVEASPPALYVGVRLSGISMPDWVAIATLIYILLQTAHLLWRWFRQAKRNSSVGD